MYDVKNVREETSRSIARLLLQTEAVMINFKKPFKWSSGIISPIYTDNRILLSNVDSRRQVAEAFMSIVQEDGIRFHAVAGVATSGIPWATMLAELMFKPLVYVRPESKGYGTDSLIEGRLPEGSDCILIDDLISTGGSLIRCVNNIRQTANVVRCYSIFTYSLQASKEAFEKEAINCYSLTDFKTLSEEAVKMEKISQDDMAIILQFSKEPAIWASKAGKTEG